MNLDVSRGSSLTPQGYANSYANSYHANSRTPPLLGVGESVSDVMSAGGGSRGAMSVGRKLEDVGGSPILERDAAVTASLAMAEQRQQHQQVVHQSPVQEVKAEVVVSGGKQRVL